MPLSTAAPSIVPTLKGHDTVSSTKSFASFRNLTVQKLYLSLALGHATEFSVERIISSSVI